MKDKRFLLALPVAMETGKGTDEKGFTLIEVIITIVVLAILATMLFTYFGKAFTGSSTPATRLDNALQLQTVMENITDDYVNLNNPSNNQHDLATLQTRIGTENSVMNNNYGKYKVVENHYIKYDLSVSYQEQPDTTNLNLLKATVQSMADGERLTLVFSK